MLFSLQILIKIVNLNMKCTQHINIYVLPSSIELLHICWCWWFCFFFLFYFTYLIKNIINHVIIQLKRSHVFFLRQPNEWIEIGMRNKTFYLCFDRSIDWITLIKIYWAMLQKWGWRNSLYSRLIVSKLDTLNGVFADFILWLFPFA